MPISISSSGRSKVGVPAAGTMHDDRAMPIERAFGVDLDRRGGHVGERRPGLGLGPGDLLDEDGAADAATTGRVQRVLDRDVVVGDDRRDLDLAGHELRRQLEVEDVAGVVLDDVEDAGAAVDGPGRRLHLVRDGRGEDVAGARGVEHAQADEAAVERLMAGAAARDQRDLALDRATGPQDDEVGGVDLTTSALARPRPARLSGTRFATSLRSFFIGGRISFVGGVTGLRRPRRPAARCR